MSCCTPDGSCQTSTTATATENTKACTTVYAVSGMTCEHCRQAVTKEISALDEVFAVEVDLNPGTLTVVSATELDDQRIRAAVDKAGYELTGRA